MIDQLPPDGSPWHSGERTIHQKMGNVDRLESIGRRVVRDHMPDQHRVFYGQLPLIIVGALDVDGQPWATYIEGHSGFITSPDPFHLNINALPSGTDPVREMLINGSPIGLLGIEFHTRRRNRLNGLIQGSKSEGFVVQVGQSFGNCPRYIQLRELTNLDEESSGEDAHVERMPSLDDDAIRQISQADTLFVASSHPGGEVNHREPSVDVSHRGGAPGFVRVEDSNTLCVPDFSGNMHFSTLGNFITNPRAGIVFIDFKSGDVLQLVGDVEVFFENPSLPSFPGAERLWKIRVREVIRRRKGLRLRFSLKEISPHSVATGNW